MVSEKTVKAEADIAEAKPVAAAAAAAVPAKNAGKEGYLDALGQRGTAWKKRYFVLKKNFLHYFKQKGDQRG